MAAEHASSDIASDIASDSDSSFELEIESDGVMRLFMFEPQHGTSSEDESDSNMAQDPPKTVESDADETINCVTERPESQTACHHTVYPGTCFK